MFLRALFLGLAVLVAATGGLIVLGPTVVTGVAVSKIANTYDRAGLNTTQCKEQSVPRADCLKQPMTDLMSRLPPLKRDSGGGE